MKVELRCIKTKNGSKCYVLVVNDVYVTFEREKILRACDMRPSELDVLDIGESITL